MGTIVAGGGWSRRGQAWWNVTEFDLVTTRARRHGLYLLKKKFKHDSLWTRLRCWMIIDFVIIRIKRSYLPKMKKRWPGSRPNPYILR